MSFQPAAWSACVALTGEKRSVRGSHFVLNDWKQQLYTINLFTFQPEQVISVCLTVTILVEKDNSLTKWLTWTDLNWTEKYDGLSPGPLMLLKPRTAFGSMCVCECVCTLVFMCVWEEEGGYSSPRSELEPTRLYRIQLLFNPEIWLTHAYLPISPSKLW